MNFSALLNLKKVRSKLTSSENAFAIDLISYANHEGEFAPSIISLIALTKMTKRTIRKHIKSLIDKKIIEDTGRRKGKTGSIPVYKLSVMTPITDQKETKINHAKGL